MPEALCFPGYSARYVSYMSTSMATRVIAGITVPSSPLISAALDFAREHLEDWAYNHAVRSWLLGTAIADRMHSLAHRDRELHSIATILHHLGCDKDGRFVSRDKAFEVDSANATRAFVERQGSSVEWDQGRKQLLWDAVALHTHVSIAMHKQNEVAATVLGITTDFRGPDSVPGNVVTRTEWQNIARQFPRTGLRSGFAQKMCRLCRSKPETTYNTMAGDFGEELVEDYSREGHRWYDIFTNPVGPD